MIVLDEVVAEPGSGAALRRASEDEVARIDEAVRAGAAKVDEGQLPSRVTGAYVGDDDRTVYADDPQGFPSLLVERRIRLDKAL